MRKLSFSCLMAGILTDIFGPGDHSFVTGAKKGAGGSRPAPDKQYNTLPGQGNIEGVALYRRELSIEPGSGNGERVRAVHQSPSWNNDRELQISGGIRRRSLDGTRPRQLPSGVLEFK